MSNLKDVIHKAIHIAPPTETSVVVSAVYAHLMTNFRRAMQRASDLNEQGRLMALFNECTIGLEEEPSPPLETSPEL